MAYKVATMTIMVDYHSCLIFNQYFSSYKGIILTTLLGKFESLFAVCLHLTFEDYDISALEHQKVAKKVSNRVGKKPVGQIQLATCFFHSLGAREGI